MPDLRKEKQIMKKLRMGKIASEYITKNKWQYFVACMSLILGVFIGSGIAFMMNGEKADGVSAYVQNFISAYNLQSVNKVDVFKFSVYNNIKVVLLMWVSGLWLWFIPVSFVQLGVKGYRLGFSMAAFVRVLGGRGILFSAVSALPQVFLLVPALIIYAVINVNFALCFQRMRRQKSSASSKTELYLKNLFSLIGIIIVSIICSLADAYVMPVLLKPVCAFLSR